MSAFFDEKRFLESGMTLDMVQALRQAYEGDFSAQPYVIPPTWTLATLPDVPASGMIYVSDAARTPSGTGSLCFADGTNWIDVTTGAAVV